MTNSDGDLAYESEFPGAPSANNVLVASRVEDSPDRDPLREYVVDDAIRDKYVLHVTIEESSQELLTRWYRRRGRFPERLAVISASESVRSTSSQASLDGAIRYPYLTTVDGPSDLRGIGTKTKELLERWHGDGTPIEIVFDSVDDLLDHRSRESVFAFLHVFTRSIENADATCYYRIDATATEETTVRVLSKLTDAVVWIDADGTEAIDRD